MDKIVEILENGTLKLHLDMASYARPAVMKVLGRWTNRYAISFRKAKTFDVTLQPLNQKTNDISVSPYLDSQKIQNELLQEMLRHDTIAQTIDIRKLLVGRALFATCIEVDQAAEAGCDNVESISNWEKDSRQILISWNGQG
jgi:hypothetical protein